MASSQDVLRAFNAADTARDYDAFDVDYDEDNEGYDSGVWSGGGSASRRGSFYRGDRIKALLQRQLMVFAWHALSQPVRVSSTLLQVQCLPRLPLLAEESSAIVGAADVQDSVVEEEEELDEDVSSLSSSLYSSDADERSFDPTRPQSRMTPTPTSMPPPIAPTTTDNMGYLAPTNSSRQTAQSTSNIAIYGPHQIPALRESIWATIDAIRSCKHEGTLSLWKGLFTFYVRDQLSLSTRVVLEDFLNEYFDLYDPSVIPMEHQETFWPNLLTYFVSTTIASVLWSPFEVVETRLIVQSSTQKRYRGLVHASFALAQEQDTHLLLPQQSSLIRGIRAFYPNLTLTIVYHSLANLVQPCNKLLIQRFFRVSIHRNPFLYGSLHCGLGIASYLILVPLDTVRKRLQAQERAHALYPGKQNDQWSTTEVRKCISTPVVPYTGFWNCLKRIVIEEAKGYPSSSNKRGRNPPSSSSSEISRRNGYGWRNGILGGILQLYRPLGYMIANRILSSAILVLSAWNLADEQDHFYF